MSQPLLWKNCTEEQCREMILSLRLLGYTELSEEKQLAVLYGMSNHASAHYREAVIPKRSGGMRRLMVPDSSLKAVQRRILKNVLSGFEPSPWAFAYRKGIGIRDNASVHTGQEKILKLDIHDFFGSITSSSVYGLAFPGTVFPPQVRGLLTSLCCLKGRLPQGSPASPAISNLVMRPFDGYMGEWCEARGIRYSRYSDDMTFSGRFDAEEVTKKAENFLAKLGMRLNRDKTGVYGRNRRQEVTGITVNEKTQLSKEMRRKLRQECYYCRRFGVQGHMERLGIDGSESKAHYLARLLGRIEYLLSINPEDAEFIEERNAVRNMAGEEAAKTGRGESGAR